MFNPLKTSLENRFKLNLLTEITAKRFETMMDKSYLFLATFLLDSYAIFSLRISPKFICF